VRFTPTLLLPLSLAACQKPAERPTASPPRPAEVSLAEFQQLRYLQGAWRGVAGGMPFYETYTFPSDSVIQSFSYPDSTLHEASDSGLIVWSGGHVTSGGREAAWIATSWDSTGMRFEPLRGASNSFTWKRSSRDAWTAHLEWPADAGRPPREYQMARIGP
jgi:hypothetical protein